MCSNALRHRLTLSLRASRAGRRVRATALTLALAPLHALATLAKWLLVLLRVRPVQGGAGRAA